MDRRPLLPYVVLLVAVAAFGLAVAAVLGGGGDDGPSVSLGKEPKIGLVEVKGPITDSKLTLEALDELAHDDKVGAILVRVDSPGGAVGPSQEIYEKLMDLRGDKPVVVSMGTVAASGGYYIASAGSSVFANAGSLTGSIGVIMAFTDLSGLMDWAKIKLDVIKTGKFKDTGASYRPITAPERAYLQDLADQVLEQFIGHVAAGRAPAGVSEGTVRAVADGRVLTGQRARDLGLVDEVGGYAEAVSKAASLAGIEGRPKVFKPKVGPTWIERVMRDGFKEEASLGALSLVPLWTIWLP